MVRCEMSARSFCASAANRWRTNGSTSAPSSYLGLRSIFWSLVRAKSDDDLREVAARLWSMAVGLEDGDISEAQAA